MADVVSILDELQNKALKDEKLNNSSSQPEQKQTRYLPSARPAGILVTNYTKWN